MVLGGGEGKRGKEGKRKGKEKGEGGKEREGRVAGGCQCLAEQ